MLRESQGQQAQDSSTQSWYRPSVVSSPGPETPRTPSSSSYSSPRPSPMNVSSSEAAAIIAALKDKRYIYTHKYPPSRVIYVAMFDILLMNLFSVDDLRKLLSDKDAYHQFLLSLDQVKIQNNVSYYHSSLCCILRLLT